MSMTMQVVAWAKSLAFSVTMTRLSTVAIWMSTSSGGCAHRVRGEWRRHGQPRSVLGYLWQHCVDYEPQAKSRARSLAKRSTSSSAWSFAWTRAAISSRWAAA